MKTSKPAKLELAGLIAPTMRDQKQRAFKVVAPNGQIVGTVTTAELQEAVAKRSGIELAISESASRCHARTHIGFCGKVLSKTSIRRGGRYCRQHSGTGRRLPPVGCGICGKPVSMPTSRRARRLGIVVYCGQHKLIAVRGAAAVRRLAPEEKRERQKAYVLKNRKKITRRTNAWAAHKLQANRRVQVQTMPFIAQKAVECQMCGRLYLSKAAIGAHMALSHKRPGVSPAAKSRARRR